MLLNRGKYNNINDSRQIVLICASVAKQYSLVLAMYERGKQTT